MSNRSNFREPVPNNNMAFWQESLLSLERTDADYVELSNVWEKAKASIEANEEEWASIYRTFIYLTYRYLKKKGIDNFSSIEELFAEALGTLQEKYGRDGDGLMGLRKNFAYFLYTKLKKPQRANSIWSEIISQSGLANTAALWLEYLGLERHFGDIANARRHFYTAVNSVTDNPHEVFAAFIQFEREEGTLEELDKALERVNAQLRRTQKPASWSKKANKKSENQIHNNFQITNSNMNKQGETMKGVNKTVPEAFDRKRISTTVIDYNGISSSKKLKDNEMVLDEDGFARPFLPQFFKNSKEEADAMNNEQESNLIGTSSFFVSKLVNENLEKIEAENSDNNILKPISSFPFSTGVEENKLFIRNVHFACTDDELKKHFSKYGKVESVRIVTHKDGKPKGVAYVDFINNEEAQKALKADGTKLRDRKLKVFISNPPLKGGKQDNIDLEPKAIRNTNSSNSSIASSVDSTGIKRVAKAGQLFLPRTLSKSMTNNSNNQSSNGTSYKTNNGASVNEENAF